MLNYQKWQESPHTFFAATGVTREEFLTLMPAFQAAYEQRSPRALTRDGQPRQRRPGGGAQGALPRVEDKRLFILVYQKPNPWHTMHGVQFDVSQPQTNDWIHHLLPVLQQALAARGHRPEREGHRVHTSPLAHEGVLPHALDGTERRRQRPKDPQAHREHDSGKKQAHTDKHLLLVNETTGKVIYLGPTEPGKTPDKKAADAAPITSAMNTTLDQDTGFQGYSPGGVLTTQPQKSPRARSCAWGKTCSIGSLPACASWSSTPLRACSAVGLSKMSCA